MHKMQFLGQPSTGKERDEETGYGYFGARYMDHELMTMWLSVDPMADKYPSTSPYAYCNWNPVKLKDPDGMETIENDDGWKVDRRNKTITKYSPLGGSGIHHISDGDFSRTISGPEEDILSQYPGYTLNDYDGAPLSTSQSSAESSQEGGGHYNPASTVLDGAGGFTKGWEKTKNPAKYDFFNKPHVKGLWSAKPGASKNALNRATSKGILSPKCLNGAGLAVGAVDLSIGYIQDGGRFGVNSAGAVGSTIGGWLGAKGGALAGAKIGACFGGLYGVAIGGVVGGIVGGLGGSLAGDQAGRSIRKQF